MKCKDCGSPVVMSITGQWVCDNCEKEYGG